MKLTDVERKILLNQLAILKSLNKEDAAHYDEDTEILEEGYEIFYRDVIGEYDSMSEADSQFVMNVLDMFRALGDYVRQHPDDTEIAKNPYATFRGFSGNDESAEMAFTRFLVKTQRKFPEQLANESKTDRFNSHFPQRAAYAPMLRVYQSIERNVDPQNGPTRDQVLSILAASLRQ